MPGETNAHLLRVGRHFYVTKFSDDPFVRRLVINELIGSALLLSLGIAIPAMALITIGHDFAPEELARIGLSLRARSWLHFGSRYPHRSDDVEAYDHISRPRFCFIRNPDVFRGSLVFDKWTSNQDRRQAVYVKKRSINHFEASHDCRVEALMIDNSNIFGGNAWQFVTSPVLGICNDTWVYQGVTSLGCFEPWLSRIVNFPEETLQAIVSSVPRAWVKGEERELDRVIAHLLRRRARVPDLLNDSLVSGLLSPGAKKN